MIATVKELSTAKSSKGTPYLKGKFATPDGDRTVLIWDSSDRATVQQAFEGGRTINLPVIKEGDYWNLEKNKAITFADNPAVNPVQPVFPATSAPQPPVAGKDTPQASKASTKPCEASKDRAVVLSYAKDLVVAGKVELGDLLNKADWLLSWLRLD